MKFVGEYLKSIRIEKNCTIQELSKELKINQALLKSIETDDFPDYVQSVYIMGHIRSYANFFDLDAKRLIEIFKIQTSYNKLDENKIIPKPIKTLDLLSFTKTFYFASIFIISVSFYFMFIRPNNLDLEYAMTPDLPENLQSFIEETEMNLSLSESKNKDSNSFFFNNNKMINNFEESFDSVNSSSAVASNSKDIFLTNADYKISLTFLNPTWIQLRDIDDKIIISQLMYEGDTYSYNFLENLNLTSGNAGNIIVSFNGIVKGRMGKVGDVLESFIIDKNFNN